jgi:hypothetical protein
MAAIALSKSFSTHRAGIRNVRTPRSAIQASRTASRSGRSPTQWSQLSTSTAKRADAQKKSKT